MTDRRERTVRWVLFAGGTLFFLLLQGFFLQHLSFWNVMPFIYPILVAILGMWEGAFSGALYGLILGVLCDLVLAPPIPCFYTLIFPLAGLLSGVIAQNWLSMRGLCALLVCVLAFILTDGFHCLILAMTGNAAWSVAGFLALRETCVSLPLFLPVFFVFRWIHIKCHLSD